MSKENLKKYYFLLSDFVKDLLKCSVLANANNVSY